MTERLLYAEEVAELIGTEPGAIKQYLARSHRARAAGASGPHLFPEPADRVKRPVERGGRHSVAAWSNRWRAADIAAWVEARPESSRWPAVRREAVAAQLRDSA